MDNVNSNEQSGSENTGNADTGNANNGNADTGNVDSNVIGVVSPQIDAPGEGERQPNIADDQPIVPQSDSMQIPRSVLARRRQPDQDLIRPRQLLNQESYSRVQPNYLSLSNPASFSNPASSSASLPPPDEDPLQIARIQAVQRRYNRRLIEENSVDAPANPLNVDVMDAASQQDRFRVLDRRVGNAAQEQLRHFRDNLQLMPNDRPHRFVPHPRQHHVQPGSNHVPDHVMVPQRRYNNPLLRIIRPLPRFPTGINNQARSAVREENEASVVMAYREAVDLERAVANQRPSSVNILDRQVPRGNNASVLSRLRQVMPVSAVGQINRIQANMQLRQIYRVQNAPGTNQGRVTQPNRMLQSQSTRHPIEISENPRVKQPPGDNQSKVTKKTSSKMQRPPSHAFCPQPLAISNHWRSAIVESKPSSCQENFDIIVEVIY